MNVWRFRDRPIAEPWNQPARVEISREEAEQRIHGGQPRRYQDIYPGLNALARRLGLPERYNDGMATTDYWFGLGELLAGLGKSIAPDA